MNCPSCGASSGDGAAECPGCGVIFAKWKARQQAPAQPKSDPGLGAGTITLVLLLTAAAVWFYAKKTIVFPVPDFVVVETKPVKLFIGPSAKVQGEILIPISPLSKYDGSTRKQIYDIRNRGIAKHPELADMGYEPNDYVFGAIEDGKPWWGLEGLYFYSSGKHSSAGPSEESRFIPNPFLLVGIRESISRGGSGPDGSANYYPSPTRLSWNSAESSARVAYDVSGYFDFTTGHDYPAKFRRELQFVFYNARDLGFRFFALDRAKSKGVEPRLDSDKPVGANQHIHCGGSCGQSSGCNNMSPLSEQYLFEVPAAPAKAVIKLWKNEPEDIAAPADMTFTIDMS